MRRESSGPFTKSTVEPLESEAAFVCGNLGHRIGARPDDLMGWKTSSA